ncbi:glutamate--cysteine ligase [Paeniglutamicibacter cryotolerans]|nr:YbdK family carboxylate-amine ligase [Paeniglutamicibacter cryotolerans]
MRTFGIEEEFFLIDPGTSMPILPDAETARILYGVEGGGSNTTAEFLACQVESATPVCVEAAEALASLRGYRKELARTARELNLLPVGVGTPPLIPVGSAVITDQERYRNINAFLPGIGAEQYVGGLHIHVSIPDADTGVHVLNSLRPWLPVLSALGANSPFWRGGDSGFASWRSIQYRKWSVQGIQPHFLDAADYHRRLAFMLSSDVVLDAGHIGWAARLSGRYPTVEIRMVDAQMRPEDSLLIALLARALVDTALHRPEDPSIPAPEALDLAYWQGAKHGMTGNQLDPRSGGGTVSTDHRVSSLLEYVVRALEDNGDRELVEAGLARIKSEGNGAIRQRRSFAEGGFDRVLADAATEVSA